MPDNDLELLQNFIHDLKSPLSSAKSFIDLLVATGNLSDDQQHFAHRALNNLDRAYGIITTLLEYARMESGGELDVEICDLLEIIEEISEMVDGIARERQISIYFDIPDGTRLVQADEQLLESVLLNLLTNAIKYNKISGDVRIATSDAGEFVQISISDTGFGIPEEALDHIFTRFYRVERKEHMQVEGTGIGLAMVKGIIEKHGGSISVESEIGKGSIFTFTLLRANSSSPDYNREPADGLDDDFQEDRPAHDDHDSGEQP